MRNRSVVDKEGIVLILVPGAFKNSKLFWDGPKKLLSALGYQNIFLVDYKSRDRSYKEGPSKGLGILSFETDVFDCKLQISSARDKFGPNKKYILVGYSKSGLVGQILAERGLVDGLVAINPTVPKGFSSVTPSSFWWTKDVLFQIIRRFSFRVPVRKSYKNFVRGHLPTGVRHKVAKKCFGRLVWESGQVIWDLAFRKPELNPSLASCPFLFFASRQDQIVKCSSVGEVFDWHCKSRKEENAKGMHLFVLDGAHYPFIGKQTREVISQIDRWVVQNF